MKPILLVVENREKIFIEYAKWFMHAFALKELGAIFFWGGKRKPIWYMRRELIKKALSVKECTHILFVDTDVIPSPGFVDKLLAHNCDMVSGVYFHDDGTPVSRKDNKPYEGKGLEEVDMCAMGASLIKREVLEKVEYPEPDNITIDADIEFCRLVKEAGFTVKQDFDIRLPHLLTVEVIY